MKKAIILIGIILLFLLFFVFPFIHTYNKIIEKNQGVSSAWSQVEVVYQRRFDLFNNLVNTVQGAATFEKSTLTQVIEARAKATQVNIDASKLNEQNMQQFQEAQGRFSSTMSRLLVTVEQYPQLKATDAFREFQSQIEGTENRIAVERRNFNQVALDYNTYILKFPKNFIANMFGFQQKPYFSADREATKAPQVKFNQQ
jgi:LemA protein